MTAGTEPLDLGEERGDDLAGDDYRDILEDWEAHYTEHEADIDYHSYLDWLKDESE